MQKNNYYHGREIYHSNLAGNISSNEIHDRIGQSKNPLDDRVVGIMMDEGQNYPND
jgi:hypothetical protein